MQLDSTGVLLAKDDGRSGPILKAGETITG